jgi:hypothetical protein
MASRILDLPLPLRPVIELKLSSHPDITVRTAYDLKPCFGGQLLPENRKYK